MSLIHLEKSVLTFHLKEILEDGHGNHPLTWLSLGLLMLGPRLLGASKSAQPAPKTASRSQRVLSRNVPISLSQWIAEAKQQELTAQLYTAIEHQNTLLSETVQPTSDAILSN
ncbi:hypothetical protein ACN4EK_00135 [Pantanalinema rosaneae CENA516]|uniref:hypothetical protein n=1 Tax=Pantanalinema rosaneae TaxID=1620701 RepID=UPI003D6E1664